jgi:hypothetical protein
MRSNHRMLMLLFQGDEFVQEAEKFVNLRLGEISVVAGVFDFESVDFRVLPGDYVWQGA